MTDEEILEMVGDMKANPQELIAFARLVAKKQREIDAEICQRKADEVRVEGITSNALGFMVQDYEECAAAIMAQED